MYDYFIYFSVIVSYLIYYLYYLFKNLIKDDANF